MTSTNNDDGVTVMVAAPIELNPVQPPMQPYQPTSYQQQQQQYQPPQPNYQQQQPYLPPQGPPSYQQATRVVVAQPTGKQPTYKKMGLWALGNAVLFFPLICMWLPALNYVKKSRENYPHNMQLSRMFADKARGLNIPCSIFGKF